MPVLDRTRPPLALDRIRAQIRDLETENIAELAVRAGAIEDVITLWYGEGDLVTPAFIRDAAKAALDAGQTFYVPDMRGLPALTEALSAYLTRLHGRDYPVARSTITPGGMQAVFLALEMIVDSGTNVVYIEPQWPNIRHAIHVAGGEPRPVALDYVDDEWRLDLDKLFAACDARTRAIMFSTPSNPLGWTASREELEALIDFSRRTGIWIVSDELYNRLSFHAETAPSVLQIAEPEDLVMSVNGFSKAWAMTGWRIGWLTHPPSVAKALGGHDAIHEQRHGRLRAGRRARRDRRRRAVREGGARALPGRRRGRLRGAFAARTASSCRPGRKRRHVRRLRGRRRSGFARRLPPHPGGARSRACARLALREVVERVPAHVRLPGHGRDHAKPAAASPARSAAKSARRCRPRFGPSVGTACRPITRGRREMRVKTACISALARRDRASASADRPAAAETWTVGAYPANPPWENKKEDGTFEGFEVDLVNEIGKRLGADVNIQDLGFQALFAATSSGRIDMAISSITITNDRLQNQSFTQGYYDSDLALVTRQGFRREEPGRHEGQADRRHLHLHRRGVDQGATGRNTASASTRATTPSRTCCSTRRPAASPAPSATSPASSSPSCRCRRCRWWSASSTGDRYGIMMEKGSPLLERVNDAITAIKKDGTHGRAAQEVARRATPIRARRP